MSRRISFDPKILPIIFEIWPPIVMRSYLIELQGGYPGMAGSENGGEDGERCDALVADIRYAIGLVEFLDSIYSLAAACSRDQKYWDSCRMITRGSELIHTCKRSTS